MTAAVTRWWRALPEPAKFRLYSRWTLQSAVVIAVVALAAGGPGPWSVAGVVVSGIAGMVSIERRPELASRPDVHERPSTLRVAAAVQVAVWGAAAIVAHLAADDAVDGARTAGLCAASVASLAVVAYARRRWWLLAAVSVATGAVFGASPAAAVRLTAVVLGIGVIFVGTTLLTLWALRLVEDLDRARDVEAELQVAEERLRFARDLHDVVGRGFSAVAVKSELAGTLVRAGEYDRARAEMDDVKDLAVESMEQMRTLVREYRDVDLATELAGARSLLDAVGCRLIVEGDPASVPARFHEVAAWVTREGATNIVRHSAATSATLSLGASGMSLRNDGVVEPPKEHSGLRGLAERLAAVGARLDADARDGQFTLEIRWPTS